MFGALIGDGFLKEALAALFLLATKLDICPQLVFIFATTMMPQMHQIHFKHVKEYLI